MLAHILFTIGDEGKAERREGSARHERKTGTLTLEQLSSQQGTPRSRTLGSPPEAAPAGRTTRGTRTCPGAGSEPGVVGKCAAAGDARGSFHVRDEPARQDGTGVAVVPCLVRGLLPGSPSLGARYRSREMFGTQGPAILRAFWLSFHSRTMGENIVCQ